MQIYRLFAACSLLAIALGPLSGCGENAENSGNDADAGVSDSGADAEEENDAAQPPTLCDADERVTGGECASCPPGTVNEPGDDTAGGDTACDAILCAADEHVAENTCAPCAAGTTNMAGDDASGDDTSCDGVMCPSSQHVEANACVPCPAGTGNEAGDDASGADTACDPIFCAENEHVVANTCVACPEGTENPAGDDAAGSDTACAPATVDVLSVALGERHSCALVEGGLVKCWGDNDFGQLGTGDTLRVGDNPDETGMNLAPVDLGTGRTAVAIDAGKAHTCALLDDGTVKCWGYNAAALGLGDTEHRGDEPGEMGDALPTVDLGTGRTAVAIATGGDHTCAILDDATAKCWGVSLDGALGLESEVSYGYAPGQMGDALPTVDLDVMSVSLRGCVYSSPSKGW